MMAAIVPGPSSSIVSSTSRRYVACRRLRGDLERRPVRIGRVEVDEAAGEGLVRRPPHGPAAGRHRVPRRAVIRAVVGEDLVAPRLARLLVVLAGDLHRRSRWPRCRRSSSFTTEYRSGEQAQQPVDQLQGAVVGRHGGRRHREPPELGRAGVGELGVAVARARRRRCPRGRRCSGGPRRRSPGCPRRSVRTSGSSANDFICVKSTIVRVTWSCTLSSRRRSTWAMDRSPAPPGRPPPHSS